MNWLEIVRQGGGFRGIVKVVVDGKTWRVVGKKMKRRKRRIYFLYMTKKAASDGLVFVKSVCSFASY